MKNTYLIVSELRWFVIRFLWTRKMLSSWLTFQLLSHIHNLNLSFMIFMILIFTDIFFLSTYSSSCQISSFYRSGWCVGRWWWSWSWRDWCYFSLRNAQPTQGRRRWPLLWIWRRRLLIIYHLMKRSYLFFNWN